ncbi:uncharacterized protein LOC142985573 [Anticarsia gemmatalis]|uniref:uncharacterized protein LOC142985573 n=1 Tax=Anticarsia gemmatalis TaxID=129554 RepID=UPI003F758188
MSTSDGVKKEPDVPIDDSLEVGERRESSESGENIPLEGFRGFEKVPRVVVQRYDITPYLHTVKNHTLNEKIGKTGAKINSVHSSRLSQICLVQLAKQDLKKLQQAVLARRERQTSSDSGSDQENIGMTNIKCKICEKVYSSEKKLLKHQENKHMIIYKPNNKPQKRVSFSDHVIIHEVKEYHKCRKCTKIFETYKFLKTHMKLLHKKRKCYICNYCNKSFADRTFFKVHIRLHCDICGLWLPNKLQYAEHRRNICRTMKLHKCKTCNDSYFKFMDLKDHSYDHVSTCFVCDICKDQLKTKCELAHHISFLHSNDRPTSLYGMRALGNERLYLCNFCDESSVEREVIESHVSLLPDLTNKAMTGYKDYYFCDQCMKKFDTETTMLQHKWTHFLKTSDNSQIREKRAKKKIKTTFRNGEVIPEYMKPIVVLEPLRIGGKILTDMISSVDVKTIDVNNGEIKKAIVDPKSKKTILSKHQCQTCGKYYSTSYCLNRHIETLHLDYNTLRCKVCEETFVWPSLLKSHKCIRLNHPEMPFEDSRPEIYFDNLHEITQNGFDIAENEDYLNSVDFEIPAPIVELTEYDSFNSSQKLNTLSNLGYKLVMHEVPIEF